jgi:hypothetical protein
MVKATTVQKMKRRDSKKSWEGTKNKKDPQAQKQVYLESLEQSPGTRRTQRQGKEIFASKPAEHKNIRENQATKKASAGSTTHIIRRSCGSRNLKRSTHCPRLLQMLGGTNRGTLLRKDF